MSTSSCAWMAYALGLWALQTSPVLAHEFWLEPSHYQPKRGESVPISIRVGQHFKGDSFPYMREEFKKFVIVTSRGEQPVKGVPGDDPAASLKIQESGLAVVSHYSTPEILNFETLEKFETYLQMEGLQHIAQRHLELGKPTRGIKESYSRCAKLLMSVDRALGQDRLTGMPLELVAERNPYELIKGQTLPVRLFHNGKPIRDVQVAAISKVNPEQRTLVRTDDEGRASILLSASGAWLLNAVHMTEPNAGVGADWESLWASMTFAVP